ncbi:trafficking protein particle complex subunit 13-like [Oppia nitens]|uniref:trafficking protein particle complex subunit 13-like n=1 Tax=Oppia nitens TaxID=1686743 RepID=UPI0023DCA779|nr:trafficking protein particle complex subunit 13-like [Oppia nitens]
MDMKPENMLSLKVGRVVSKLIPINHFITTEEYNSFIGSDEPLDTLRLSPTLADEWRLLPQNFGNVYLGETFSFVVNCTNDSVREVVTDVVVRVDLQVGNRVVNLGEIKTSLLDAKQCINDIMKHEVKELGSHVLICTIGFTMSSNERQNYRKFFKFQVLKPLDVKTKFYNAESDEVYLEALLQNLTTIPICLDRVMLEPSPYFDVKPMNTIINEDNVEHWVFGKVNRFNSQECRQYLFSLTPKPNIKYNASILKNLTEIGKLDIVWVTGIGERGHLQTSQLERMTPVYGDLKLIIESIESKVKLKTKFDIIFRLINCCNRSIEPILSFDNLGTNQALLWLGISGQSLGPLKPSSFVDFELSVYPIECNLHCLPTLKITDSYLKIDYKFDEIASVFVE